MSDDETKTGLDALFAEGAAPEPASVPEGAAPEPPPPIAGATVTQRSPRTEPPPAPVDPVPPRTQSGRIHYVLVQHGTLKAIQARKDLQLPEGVRLTEQVPLARLTPECDVSSIVRDKVTVPVTVAGHWDEGREMVVSSSFLCALGEKCAPLAIRVLGGILTLRWA